MKTNTEYINDIISCICLILILIALDGCSSASKAVQTSERAKLTVTTSATEEKTEVECFCPEQKEDKSSIITAIGGVVSGIVGAIF